MNEYLASIQNLLSNGSSFDSALQIDWSRVLLDPVYGEALRDDHPDWFDESTGRMKNVRRIFTSKYCWSVPTAELLESFSGHGRVLSVGAGTAYLEHLLAERGVDIVATDFNVWPHTEYSHGEPWMEIEQASALVAVHRHRDRDALLVAWPPCDEIGNNYSSTRWTDDGEIQIPAHSCGFADALHDFRGDTVLYVGEGRGGCTGSFRFWDELERNFIEESYVSIPQWYGIRDYAAVYKRRGTISTHPKQQEE